MKKSKIVEAIQWVKLHKKKVAEVARFTIMSINLLLMIATVCIQIFCNRAHSELEVCTKSVVVILCLALIPFDIYLKAHKDIFIHLSWVAIWTLNLLISIL